MLFIFIQFIIISGAVRYSKAYYGKYIFEDFAQGLGWMMVSLPLLAILIVGVVQMIRYGVVSRTFLCCKLSLLSLLMLHSCIDTLTQ